MVRSELSQTSSILSVFQMVRAHGPHIQSLLTTYEHHMATWYMLAIHAHDLDPQSKAHAHDPCKNSFLFSWHLEIFVFVF